LCSFALGATGSGVVRSRAVGCIRLRDRQQTPAHTWRAAIAARFDSEDDYAGELGQVAAPVLLVWGDQDARYSRADQEALLAALPQPRLVVYASAGHMPHWEQPDGFAADLAAEVLTERPRRQR
jgi:non-heme chloroperoxidase